MKAKSIIVNATSNCNNTLPSLHDILRPPRPSVLDVNNLLCSAEEKSATIISDTAFIYASDASLKIKRKRATPNQLSVLNHVFSQTFFPPTELRIKLGKQLDMSPRTVQIWFQNKRQSMRNGREKHILRHHQRKKIDNNNNNSIHTTPPNFSLSSPLSALYCNQSMITSLPYHEHNQHQQQQPDQMLSPPPSQQQQPSYCYNSMVNCKGNKAAIKSSSPISLSSPSLIMKPIALAPLRLPSSTSECCIGSSVTSPSSTASNLPTPTSIDSIIYRD
ncbi:hypothetical protein INT45_002444 [Circinella minor]|uniref:Homeobox domain-containing protein n=1 Tax=Circinella minor TaxID=1195481 RepID=A0A8H7SCI8_9FUNG|nr:hypothetical protein INT45_002444 [Circinella minor]